MEGTNILICSAAVTAFELRKARRLACQSRLELRNFVEVGDLPVSKQFYHKDDLVLFGKPRPAESPPLYLSSHNLVESQAAEMPRSAHCMNKHYPVPCWGGIGQDRK